MALRIPLVGVSLKDLAKPSKINGLQAASKVLLFKNKLKSRTAPAERDYGRRFHI